MDDITVHDVTVDVQSASISAIGPCGALISGLEDEYSGKYKTHNDFIILLLNLFV